MTSPACETSLNHNDPAAVADLFTRAAAILRESPFRRGCTVHLPPRGTLLATGDLHDNSVHLEKVVELADLEAAADHHLTLHELIHGEHLINGMDFSHRMLIKVAQLVERCPQQVHPMLANHELSQMTGRGVSKGAGTSVELFNEALEYVFRDEWETVAEAINDFFRAFPLAVVSHPEDDSAGGVLCAHSLPNHGLMKWFDTEVLERELTAKDIKSPSGAAYAMVWGRAYTEGSVQQLAEAWNIKLFVLGHQHVETGIELRCGRVIVLNSDHASAAAVRIDLSSLPEAGEVVMNPLRLRARG